MPEGTAPERGVKCLEERARLIAEEAVALRRHEELLEWAVDEIGLDRAFAERVYDVAREEGIEPAYVFELVNCGVGVEPGSTADDAPSLQPAPPRWIEQAPPPDEAARERRLRTSARRLKSLMESCAGPAAALRSFAEAPDVDEAGY